MKLNHIFHFDIEARNKIVAMKIKPKHALQTAHTIPNTTESRLAHVEPLVYSYSSVQRSCVYIERWKIVIALSSTIAATATQTVHTTDSSLSHSQYIIGKWNERSPIIKIEAMHMCCSPPFCLLLPSFFLFFYTSSGDNVANAQFIAAISRLNLYALIQKWQKRQKNSKYTVDYIITVMRYLGAWIRDSTGNNTSKSVHTYAFEMDERRKQRAGNANERMNKSPHFHNNFPARKIYLCDCVCIRAGCRAMIKNIYFILD